MNLLKEILIKALEKEEIVVNFPNIDIGKFAEMQSYEALEKIKAIVSNDSLSDFECVEEIVSVLELYGSNGGSRHDF